MGKRPDKVKPPRFKKKANRQSARFARNSFRFKNGVLSLSKIGAIPIVWHRRVRGEPSPIGGHEHQDVQLLPWKKVVSGVVASSFVGGPVQAPHRPKALSSLRRVGVAIRDFIPQQRSQNWSSARSRDSWTERSPDWCCRCCITPSRKVGHNP